MGGAYVANNPGAYLCDYNGDGSILAERYGDVIVGFVSGVSSKASQEKVQLEQGVKD